MRRHDRTGRPTGRQLTPWALTVVAALASATLASAAPAGKPKSGGGSNEPKTFELSGTVSGLLYPGVSRTLTLKIENPYSFAVDVTSPTVTVGTPSPECSGAYLEFSPFAGPVRVAEGESATLELEAVLAPDADDRCQNVLFPLTYTAAATRAG